MRIVLGATTTDVERAMVMVDMTAELTSLDLDEALPFAKETLEFTRSIGEKALEAQTLAFVGELVYGTENRELSLQYFEESVRLAEEMDLGKVQAMSLMSIAKYHRYVTMDSLKTVDNFLKSAEVSKKVNFVYGVGRSYAKLASFYAKYNKIQLCRNYMEQSVENYLQYSDGQRTIAHYYNEVGDKLWDSNPRNSMDFYIEGMKYKSTPDLKSSMAKAYSYIGDHKTALKYLEEAVPFFRENEKSKRKLGVVISQLAEVHLKLGDYKSSNDACDDGIALLVNLGRTSQRGLPALYRIKGVIAEQRGDDETALEYYEISKDEAKRVKNGLESANIALTLGTFYSKMDLSQAKFYCSKAHRAAARRKYSNIEIEACECLYSIYLKEDSCKDALYYHQLKTALSDSLSALNVKHSLNINTRIAEKDKQISEQNYRNNLREKELEFQDTLIKLLMAAGILGLFLIGFLSYSYRRISGQNEEIKQKTAEIKAVNLSLEQSNEELERFAHIASHDLKSPLRNIISFTALLRRNIHKEDKTSVLESLDFIENNGKRMNRLIEDVLEYSTHANQSSSQDGSVDLNEVVDEIKQLSLSTTSLHSIEFDVSDLPTVKYNASKMFLLFKNLIENGLKYNDSLVLKIKISGKASGDYYSVLVEDNGIGIKEEYFDTIFIMFQRLHTQDKYEGTGLGLATCKKIVEDFEGKISIESQVGKGTKFRVDIPNDLLDSSISTPKPNTVLS